MGREQSALAGRWCTPLAIAAYLAVALMVFGAVLPAPSRLLPYPAQVDAPGYRPQLERLDQSMVVSTVTRNASTLVTAPWNFRNADGQCYPMPRAYTLGEHMLGLGMLAATPWALTHEPILSYNVALIAALWIRAIAMYLLAFELTRSRPAAFFAGLAFALVPTRIVDPNHSFGHGDHWGPLVLLFLHRVIAQGGVGNGLALGAFTGLQLTESLYPLVSTGIVASVYGAYSLWQHRQTWQRTVASLLVAALVIVAVAWWVLHPYLETRAVWGVLADRVSVLLKPSAYLPGHDHFLDWLVLGLAIVALADRTRRVRPVAGEDPRLAFLIAALLAAWCSLQYLAVPRIGFYLRSPLAMLREIVPGLNAVRALAAVSMGAQLAVCVLAGYGVLALTERMRTRTAILTVAALSLALLALRFHDPLARASFGQSLRLTSYDARPIERDLELLQAIPPGPAVNLPPSSRADGNYRMRTAAHFVLASFSPRPISACYNSFMSPVQRQVDALAEGLPDRDATGALAALGFDQILARKKDMRGTQLKDLEQAATDDGSGLRLIGESADLAVFSLARPTTIESDPQQLRAPASAAAAEPVRVTGLRGSIPVIFENSSENPFRLSPPIAPVDLVARWTSADGGLALETRLRDLLPLAVAGKGVSEVAYDLALPPRVGSYRLTIARAADPDHPLGARRVDVVALEDVYPPEQAMMRANPDFINLALLARPPVAVAPPRSVLSLRVVPQRADRVVAAQHAPAGDLMLRWVSLDKRKLVATTSAALVPDSPVGEDADVTALVPVLPKGHYLALLVPVAEPNAVLLGGIVAIGGGERAPR